MQGKQNYRENIPTITGFEPEQKRLSLTVFGQPAQPLD